MGIMTAFRKAVAYWNTNSCYAKLARARVSVHEAEKAFDRASCRLIGITLIIQSHSPVPPVLRLP